MKKVVIVSIIIVLVLAISGYFSMDYIFDKMIGNQILSQLELELLPDDLINNIIDSNLGNEAEETQETDKNLAQTNEFTKESLKEIQESMSTIDKIKVVSMITNKLSMDEIKTLSSLSSGGVDNTELNNIKEVLKGKLSNEDIEYLKNLYGKYNQ